jgi:hypothetical protein
MVGKEQLTETDAELHVGQLKQMLEDVVAHLHENVEQIHEPKAQALFEIAIVVVTGLKTACEHYQAGTGAAVRR